VVGVFSNKKIWQKMVDFGYGVGLENKILGIF
jgi:hypothetical protein